MIGFQKEIHPFEPFLPEKAKALMLGSFPPPKAKWKMDFYYPNFQNDMWRIFGLAFSDDKDHFLTNDKTSFDKQRITVFLNEKGIALYDVAFEIVRLRDNASDNFLEIVQPIDLYAVLARIPLCRTLVTTGEKATNTLWSLLPVKIEKPSIGCYEKIELDGKIYRFYRMPSSSRAYPKPLSEKTEIYKHFFAEIGLC
ncbi:uracil-DNA glycosylase family protein [Anaerorudis cellulosivorans]|uniref:uracil-DNA glycosylase family protein n=1 Tax=Anaerorudis cellulosivorans TaxID=3397862 RepID=UPI00221F91F8|nr:uracil-DNA glycosylase family protein [Seramator thermalis]MCW1735032.1 uracil-DNA glycosylase family protein [Seramator thermalis]